jgi:Domain of unknown function (DUF6378)
MNAEAYVGNDIRKDLIAQVEQAVCKDRQATHGRPENNFLDIAALWQTYTGHPFSSKDVAVMMICVKLARIKSNPNHDDNWIDAAGYAICGGSLPQL